MPMASSGLMYIFDRHKGYTLAAESSTCWHQKLYLVASKAVLGCIKSCSWLSTKWYNLNHQNGLLNGYKSEIFSTESYLSLSPKWKYTG